DRVDEEERPALRFDEKASQIFADDSEDEELDAAEEQHRRDEARPAGDDIAAEPARKRVGEKDEGQTGRNEADMAGEAQRRDREAGDRVEREADHLGERILRRASVALGAIII